MYMWSKGINQVLIKAKAQSPFLKVYFTGFAKLIITSCKHAAITD